MTVDVLAQQGIISGRASGIISGSVDSLAGVLPEQIARSVRDEIFSQVAIGALEYVRGKMTIIPDEVLAAHLESAADSYVSSSEVVVHDELLSIARQLRGISGRDFGYGADQRRLYVADERFLESLGGN